MSDGEQVEITFDDGTTTSVRWPTEEEFRQQDEEFQRLYEPFSEMITRTVNGEFDNE